MSGCIRLLSYWHSPVFLVNSCLDRFAAPSLARRDPLSRSYRVSLPSSLTVIHPSASVYSTRPRVSVYGTGATRLMFSGFSWRHGRQSAPTPFNRLFRQPAAVSHPRHRVTPGGSTGILTGSAIGLAWRLSLRARLTLIRLALIRKPWSFGEGVSRPLYRYLYLHLLFHMLQRTSRAAFGARWNAPLPILFVSRVFGRRLIPDYYPCRLPRLVSCYALFK